MAMSTRENTQLHVVESVEDAEALREQWQAAPWARAEFDLDFFLAVLDDAARAQPYAVFAERDGAIVAGLAGKLERKTLPAKVGYRNVYKPKVRAVTVLPGGAFAVDDEAAGLAVDAIGETLAGDRADVLALLGLPTESPLHRAATGLGGRLRRELFAPRRPHWRLDLPDTFEEFLASRSKSTREGVKRYGKRLEKTFGDELSLELYRQPEDIDRIAHDLAQVAAKTYQAGLGVAFSDVEEQRRRVRLGLERGWFRAYVLYLAGEPVAFWHGYAYNRTFVIGIPGYDPAYSDQRVGTYVQMRLIRDLCADPDVDAIDYGRGDAEYKRRFGTESWEEQDVVVFAPTARGVAINTARNAIIGAATGAKSALAKAGVADRVKKRWRARLSSGDAPPNPPS